MAEVRQSPLADTYQTILFTRLDLWDHLHVRDTRSLFKFDVIGKKNKGRVDDRVVIGKPEFMLPLESLFENFVDPGYEHTKKYSMSPESELYTFLFKVVKFFSFLISRSSLPSSLQP